MSIYLIFILSFFLCIFLQKKTASIVFPILWFIVIGLRHEIGTDWYPTLEFFERAILNEKSFNSYQLVDTELFWKLIATIWDQIGIAKEYIFIFISFIEAIIISHLIKNSKDHRLAIIALSTVFFLFFPMNAIRQGFCLIAIVASFSSILRMKFFGNILAFTSHLSSIPVILALKVKVQPRYIILLILPFFAAIYLIQDLILIRYVDIYGSLGFSPRLALQSILTILLIISFDTSSDKFKHIALILFFYLSTYFIFFSYRFVGFLAAFYILYYGIYFKTHNVYKVIIFLLASFSFFFSDLSDIYRATYSSELKIPVECFKCTPWIPYDNYLFRELK